MKAVQIGAAGHAMYAYNAIKSRKIEFAAISCGSHGNEAENISGALAGLEKRGFSPKLYDDWRDMLDREKPDIVIINPWFCDNADCAVYALERNIDVFCEKPVADTLERLEVLEAAVKASDAKFAGMFGTRNEASFRAAKRAVEDGRIGEIRLMDSRKSYKLGSRPDFYKSRETYCGIIPWVAIHAIDWMAWLSGERYVGVASIHSSRANFGNGDMDITAAAMFAMTNDVIATVTADMLRPSAANSHGDDRVRLVGTKGVLEIRDNVCELISDAEGYVTLTGESGDIFAEFLDMSRDENAALSADAIEITRWALLARDYAEKQNLWNGETNE